jgi:energy-coupling factor transporter ATP-binding protein EcfA2
MEILKLDLEHCYGIKKLTTEFNFNLHGDVFKIYAPNGVMKTSLAKTFRDISNSNTTSDLIWKENDTKRLITDEDGNDLPPESIFVIEPYNEGYRSDRISTLLVNDVLRQRYEDIHKEINEKAETLTNALKNPTGLSKGISEDFSKSITHDPNDFYRALARVRDEVENGGNTALAEVIYKEIFNPKVAVVLADPNFTEKIEEYIQQYDELVSKSTFFQKGVFTHNNAAEIAKNLNSNGFFKADHSVFLRINGEKTEVSTLKDLENAIQTEKDIILTDDSLKTAFEAIDKQLQKNVDLKKFRICLENNPILLSELKNPERLRQKLWVEYLISSKEIFLDLLNTYNKGKDQIVLIVDEAKSERTKWADVISIFNERFSVPFVVRMANQEDVILKSDAPSIYFDFLEDPENRDSATVLVDEADLKRVLSNGERRALYILNIIFEVEARKTADQKTLFIVDDIADSFDYKNKYAIIEYLQEVSNEEGFQQLILSHNFDFYRTVSSRLNLKRENRILASKENGIVKLQKEIYQKSAPFSHWRDNFTNSTMLIASIPFLRNLAEFSGNADSFQKLTSLLHIKSDTAQFSVANLESLIKEILHDQDSLNLPDKSVQIITLIYQVAAGLAISTDETANLEDKVVLSIAIRLKAEEFMIREINDDAFLQSISKNQTIKLIKRYKEDFSTERENIQLLNQVNLMTPENIHLNSFMYEPILDLSAQHLKNLFSKISSI